MMSDEDLPVQDARVISHDLLADCLERIEAGDPSGFHHLAFFWMGHVSDRDPVIDLGMAEGLMRQSAVMGNAEAGTFLAEVWPATRRIFEKKLTKGNKRPG
jgi:hypothetical protein